MAFDRGRVLFAWLTLLLLPMGAMSDIQTATCSFTSPYLSLVNVPGWTYCDPSEGMLLAKPSEVSACISSFQLDADNATQYLESIKNLTRDYYIFNDVAVDPLLSDPLTTLFDYPIYNGSGYGQVNLLQELELLQEQVMTDGATLDLFLAVNKIYSKLYDGHMKINDGLDTGDMIDQMTFGFMAGEVLDDKTADGVTMAIAFPSDEFALVASISLNDGSVETKQVAKIDGKDPLDFVSALAMEPMGYTYTSLKSLGPRIQSLLQNMFTPKSPFFGVLNGQGSYDANYADFLKDKYDVQYDDGSTTTWTVFQHVPCPVAGNSTKADIEQVLTQPGALYQAFTSAKDRVAQSPLLQRRRMQSTKSRRQDFAQVDFPRALQNEESSGNDFTVSAGGMIAYAVVDDDFAVLKLGSGFEYELDDMWSAWSDLTAEANDKGVTKLIVDIIGNGGGEINLGYQLALLMYPNAEWDEFANPYDQVYAQSTDIFWNDVDPLLKGLQKKTSNETEIEITTELFNQDTDLLVLKLQSIVQGFTALEVLYPSLLQSKGAAAASKYILDNISQRANTTITEVELYLLLQQVNGLYESLVNNLKTGQGASSFTFGSDGSGSPPMPIERIRGGILGNYTTPFYKLLPEEFFRWKQQQIRQLEHPFQFEQYLILADGNQVGSTANTFQTTAFQYSKSNKGSVAPLDTVSYGGSGKIEDAAVTQFAGGQVGSADLTALYMLDLLLLVMAFLVTGMSIGPEAADIFYKYDRSIPDPCYYCNNPPALPVDEMYSVLTGANSTPLEYTNQRPSFYIKQWPFQTSLDNGADLPMLYDFTKAFFDQQDLPSTTGPSATETGPAEDKCPEGEEMTCTSAAAGASGPNVHDQNAGGCNCTSDCPGGEASAAAVASASTKMWVGLLLAFSALSLSLF